MIHLDLTTDIIERLSPRDRDSLQCIAKQIIVYTLGHGVGQAFKFGCYCTYSVNKAEKWRSILAPIDVECTNDFSSFRSHMV